MKRLLNQNFSGVSIQMNLRRIHHGIIIDSSNIEQIKELNELLTITGVTTNPTILTKSNREAMDVVKDLCEVLSEDQLLFIQTVQTSF